MHRPRMPIGRRSLPRCEPATMSAMAWTTIERVAAVMEPVGIWWAVAGGWAIDLWLGAQTREHHDVEVVIRRDDQTRAWDALAPKFELGVIDPPGSGWRPWVREPRIEAPAFQLKASDAATEFDLFLESSIGDAWVFRRDSSIRRPVAALTAHAFGVPILDPAVQLLYMAKSDEPKNEHDFDVAGDRLDDASAAWLRAALAAAHPGHRWIARLDRRG
jgi:hypothetical protein